LLGHWKNFDELEENLSLEELNALLEATRKKDYEDKKFMAAIQGVDLDESNQEVEDITTLRNPRIASEEGLGFNEGLGFLQLEE
jgi:hypothetical protein